LPIP
jgi:tetratricopeptide (TPR) repeat protein